MKHQFEEILARGRRRRGNRSGARSPCRARRSDQEDEFFRDQCRLGQGRRSGWAGWRRPTLPGAGASRRRRPANLARLPFDQRDGDLAGAVNARDRIGAGPWYNAKGVLIARNVDDELHVDNHLNKQTALTEQGEVINGRGDTAQYPTTC